MDGIGAEVKGFGAAMEGLVGKVDKVMEQTSLRNQAANNFERIMERLVKLEIVFTGIQKVMNDRFGGLEKGVRRSLWRIGEGY